MPVAKLNEELFEEQNIALGLSQLKRMIHYDISGLYNLPDLEMNSRGAAQPKLTSR